MNVLFIYVVELCLNECLLKSFCKKVNGKSEQEVFSGREVSDEGWH